MFDMMPHHDATGPIAWVVALLGLLASVLPFFEVTLRVVALMLSITASWYAIKYYRRP
jgi:hypothetical protein